MRRWRAEGCGRRLPRGFGGGRDLCQKFPQSGWAIGVLRPQAGTPRVGYGVLDIGATGDGRGPVPPLRRRPSESGVRAGFRSVHVGGLFADDGVGEEVGGELEDGAAGADFSAFGSDGEVDILAGFEGGAGEGDGLAGDHAL